MHFRLMVILWYCERLEGRKEMFYLTTHSTHFIYGYMVSDIWLRTILIGRKETHCRHIGYSFRLTATVLLYAPSHRQDNTYHGLCYTSRGALAGTRNSSNGSTPWRIDPTTHRTMSERSYHGATSHSERLVCFNDLNSSDIGSYGFSLGHSEKGLDMLWAGQGGHLF